MKTHQTLLAKLDACGEAQRWAETQPNAKTAWEQCNRPDWMVWLLTHVGFDDPKMFRLYVCWCVRNTPLADGRKVWDLLTDERSKNAVVVAERYANGEATKEERAAAWAAAWDAAWAAARDAQSNKLREMVPYAVVAKAITAHNRKR